jgi:hypothetical protein
LRAVVLTVALLFIGLLGYLTARDLASHGLTAVGVLAVFVLVLFVAGILGALLKPPDR